MPLPAAAVALDGVFELIKGWVKRKWPDPEEQRKAEMELQEFLYNKDHQEVQQFYDFVTKYEGEGDKVVPQLQVYRGSVRPTITYGLIIAYVLGVINNWPEVHMHQLYVLNLISMAFWYGERALKNLGLDISKSLFKR